MNSNRRLRKPNRHRRRGAVFMLTVVLFTATDDAGNAAICTMTVTVVDDTPPVLTCPPDITLFTGPGDEDCLVPYAPQAIATDNCDPSVTIGSNAPAQFPLGQTVVTFTATDDAGNVATCTMTVTVVDDTPPVITNLTVPIMPIQVNEEIDSFSAVFTDLCDRDNLSATWIILINPLSSPWPVWIKSKTLPV